MKKFALIFIMVLTVLTVKAQTFVVSEVNPYREDQRADADRLIGNELQLTFTDHDVRITGKNSKGQIRTQILQNMGKNIYRQKTSNSDDWDSYDELELDTFLGYIRGFSFTHIHHKTFGGSFKAKRK